MAVQVDEQHGRAEVIAWVQEQVALYGLTLSQLEAAGCFAAPKRQPVTKSKRGCAWLETPRSAAELRQRSEAIVWIRTQITRHGLSYAQLQAVGCFGTARQRAGQAQYRNAQGQTWDGRSEMPEWLQRAIAAGQSAEHFRVT